MGVPKSELRFFATTDHPPLLSPSIEPLRKGKAKLTRLADAPEDAAAVVRRHRDFERRGHGFLSASAFASVARKYGAALFIKPTRNAATGPVVKNAWNSCAFQRRRTDSRV
jgi:hypothetical protein